MKANLSNMSFVDYKDTETLKQFINPSGRIIAKRRNPLNSTQQRKVATAIKRARFMGLIPYTDR